MSHTTQLPRRWIAIHNGDFSGEIEFVSPDQETRITIPSFDLLEALVADAVRVRRRAVLEDAGDKALLYGSR